MENSNQPTPNNEETVMSNIQTIFQAFVESGGEPKVTSFKRHLDKLINQEIKPLCGRSGKTADGTDWRSEVKAKFGGRGAKWVFVSLESIQPTLSRFAEQGVDVEDYSKFIEAHGQAWVRFSGPRIDNGVKAAAFEVRTDGSTIDHPKQLHYIPLHDLDEAISFMNSTPHAMKLEEVAKPQEVETEEAVEVELSEADETPAVEEDYVDVMDNIDELMDFEDADL
tara:strand:+ start:95 stop:766 length:672 start_codon:yes stop_codon:yes gene_type:complete